LAEVIIANDLTISSNADDSGISKDAQVIGYPGDQRGAAYVSNLGPCVVRGPVDGRFLV
jgi:hypothetical protein